ncbi:hypothetical protein FI667_g10341, partial [Globisporangium splendens]
MADRLHQELLVIPGLEQLLQLRELVWKTKEQVLLALFQEHASSAPVVEALQVKIRDRKFERRAEKLENLDRDAIRKKEDSFRSDVMQIVAVELARLGAPAMITWQKLIFDSACCAQAFRLLLTKIKSSRRISSSTMPGATKRAPLSKSKQPQSEESEDCTADGADREDEPGTPESHLHLRERVNFKTKLRSTARQSTSSFEGAGGWNFDTSLSPMESRSYDNNNERRDKARPSSSPRTDTNTTFDRRKVTNQSSVVAVKMKKNQLQSLQHENATLVDENARLKDEVAHLEALNVVLQNNNNVSEPASTFDDRRMRLLQAQNLQLQRQIGLLQDAVVKHQETESNLLVSLNHWREIVEAGRREAKEAGAEENGCGEGGKAVKWMIAVPENLMAELKRVEDQIYSVSTAANSAFESKLRTSGFSGSFLRSSADSLRMADVHGDGVRSVGHLRLDRVKVLETKLAQLGKALDRFATSVLDIHSPHVGTGSENSHEVPALAEATRSVLLELGALGVVVPATSLTVRATSGTEASDDNITAVQIRKLFSSMGNGKERDKCVKCMLKQLHARHLSMENDMVACRRESQYWQRAWQTQADIVSELTRQVSRLGNKKMSWCQVNLVEPMRKIAQVVASFQQVHQESSSRQNPYLPLLIETLETQQSVLMASFEQWRAYSVSVDAKLTELFQDYEANRLVLTPQAKVV